MNSISNQTLATVRAQSNATQAAPKQDDVSPQIVDSLASSSQPIGEPKPNAVQSAPKESKIKSIFKNAAVVAAGLAVGAGAAAAGMMGGAVGAVAGMVGGATLGVVAVAGLAAGTFVAIAKESPVAAFILIAAGSVVATALSPLWIGGAIAGTVAVGALGAAGGPAAAAMAGLGCGILGAAAAHSARQAFQ